MEVECVAHPKEGSISEARRRVDKWEDHHEVKGTVKAVYTDNSTSFSEKNESTSSSARVSHRAEVLLMNNRSETQLA